MLNLEKLKFIPQSNKRETPSLDELISIEVEKKPEWDLMFTPENNQWRLKPSFYKGQKEDEGFTAAIQDDVLILIHANESAIKEMRPKFLKGEKTVGTFSSNYFNLIVVKAGYSLEEKLYLFLEEEETGIEGVKAWYVSAKKSTILSEIPVVEEPIKGNLVLQNEGIATIEELF